MDVFSPSLQLYHAFALEHPAIRSGLAADLQPRDAAPFLDPILKWRRPKPVYGLALESMLPDDEAPKLVLQSKRRGTLNF